MDEDFYICPQCGGEVRVGSPGCPKCSRPPKRRERKPWEQDETYDGVGLPEEDDDFDYEDYVAREFGEGTEKRSLKEKVIWWTALILLLAFLIVFVF